MPWKINYMQSNGDSRTHLITTAWNLHFLAPGPQTQVYKNMNQIQYSAWTLWNKEIGTFSSTYPPFSSHINTISWFPKSSCVKNASMFTWISGTYQESKSTSKVSEELYTQSRGAKNNLGILSQPFPFHLEIYPKNLLPKRI